MKQIITILTIISAFCVGSLNAMGHDIIPDKYARFLSCFSDSTYYAIENVADHEILFVSREVFLDQTTEKVTPKAIAAQLYTLDDSGKIVCLEEVRSAGTLYPLALSNGTLLTAGHHHVIRYTVDGQPVSLRITESAEETFNKKGKASYSYENRLTDEYSNPKDNRKLATLFDELENAEPIIFQLIPSGKTEN